MKRAGPAIILYLLLALLATSFSWAHPQFRHWYGQGHSHATVGVVIGVPIAPAVHYRAPAYYAYPPIVAVPAPPPVYIEQGGQDIDEEPNYWWYYCQLPQGYYPYVQRCPQGWKRVAPQPPDLQ